MSRRASVVRWFLFLCSQLLLLCIAPILLWLDLWLVLVEALTPIRCPRSQHIAVVLGASTISLPFAAARYLGGFSSSSSSSEFWLLWYNHLSSPIFSVTFEVHPSVFSLGFVCFKCCLLVFSCVGMCIALLVISLVQAPIGVVLIFSVFGAYVYVQFSSQA